jgi:hypothetical protein
MQQRKQNILSEAIKALDGHTRYLDSTMKKYENRIRKVSSYDVTAAPIDRRRLGYQTHGLSMTPNSAVTKPLLSSSKDGTFTGNILLDADARQLQYMLQNIYKTEVERLAASGSVSGGNWSDSGGAGSGATGDENLYCFCRRPSFGQMVACDSDDCKYEWYHFGCVGLETKPRGKW